MCLCTAPVLVKMLYDAHEEELRYQWPPETRQQLCNRPNLANVQLIKVQAEDQALKMLACVLKGRCDMV